MEAESGNGSTTKKLGERHPVLGERVKFVRTLTVKPSMTNKISCMLVDDDRVDLLTTEAFMESYPFIEIAGCYTEPEVALKAAQLVTPDAFFLDIDMPGLTGLELRRRLMAIPACIFITSYPDYAVESFELAALDFLVKPLEHERFAMTVRRLKEYITVRRKAEMLSHALGADTVFIKDGTQQIKVALHDIIYLEALNNYTCVVTGDRKYTVLSTLSNLLQEGAFSSFVRIHRSYAVQKHLIRKIGSAEVLIGNIALPVGRSYKAALDHITRKQS
jgi:two-component system, LytTR family, response regulator